MTDDICGFESHMYAVDSCTQNARSQRAAACLSTNAGWKKILGVVGVTPNSLPLCAMVTG
jgi:hypothetical protein